MRMSITQTANPEGRWSSRPLQVGLVVKSLLRPLRVKIPKSSEARNDFPLLRHHVGSIYEILQQRSRESVIGSNMYNPSHRSPAMKLPLILFLVLMPSAYPESSHEHWVATWTTAQPLIRQPPGPRPAAGFHNQTIRMIAHTSIGGSRLRVKLSNPFGSVPVTVGAAHVAMRRKDTEIVAGSDPPLSFHRKPGCTPAPGIVMLISPA